MNAKVDTFLSKAKKWREESEKLRTIALDCGLSEELKWGKPCYAFQKSNIVIIQGFKEYCALMFFKGALLNDAAGILTKPGENSQAQRQLRFSNIQQINDMETTLKEYIKQAIAVEKAGLKVDFKEKRELQFPEELQQKFAENPNVKAAFSALTPGRQRAYTMYFCAAKQSTTRASRIEKCVPQILSGKELNDR